MKLSLLPFTFAAFTITSSIVPGNVSLWQVTLKVGFNVEA